MKWFNKSHAKSEVVRSDEWNQRRSYRPMEVVRTDDGDLIPPFDETWDDATKLQWHAGVLEADTGFAVAFYQPASGRHDTVDWSAFGMVAPQGAASFAALRPRDFPLFGMGVKWGIRWAKEQVQNNV